MITIELTPETEDRLQAEATRQGIPVTDFAKKLIESALSKPTPDYATIALLDKWEKENATDDPEVIAREQIEFEEFVEGMNRNRLEMEGPESHPVYP